MNHPAALPFFAHLALKAPEKVPQSPSGILRQVTAGETARLLGAALAKESESLGLLLERLRPRIVLWAASRLSPELRAKVEPDDVAQIVLLAVHRSFAQFGGADEGQLLAWVFAIGNNRIKDLARYFGADKRRSEAEEQGIGRDLMSARAEARCFSQTSPSQAAVRRESLTQMRRALQSLEEPQRSVLRMRDLEMRSYHEIVEELNLVSESAARTLRCRALIALRRAMQRTTGFAGEAGKEGQS